VFELAFVWRVHDLLNKVDTQISREAAAACVNLVGDKYLSNVLRANPAAIAYA